MSIFWIWTIAKILVDLLTTIGVLLNIPSSFLGMTLLSFGNSASDLSLNCALAKEGYGEMGISGSIGGPLFNTLIGLGSSMIKKTINKLLKLNLVKTKLLNLIYFKILYY